MELDAIDPAVEDVHNWLEIEMTDAENGRVAFLLNQDQPHSSGVSVTRSTQASICVTPNAIAQSSRAGIPWFDFQQSRLLQCRIVFDCGDGGFFFQPCSPEVLNSSKSLKDQISQAIGAGKCKQVWKPAVGLLCLAPFDREYHRAEIIASKAEETWQLFYIDYGNTKILKANDLLTLPAQLQAQCRLCAFAYWDQVLAGEKNGGELRSCFDFETESAALTFRMQITTGQYIVQIGSERASAIFKVELPAPLIATYQWPDCEFSPQLKPNKLVRIVFDWNPTTFHVVALADNEQLAKLHQLIWGYAAKAERFRTPPSRDEIVLAQYEGTFFRAKVDSVEGDLCTCTFIDYGGPTVCKIYDLIPVNSLIMKYPIMGMTVQLNKVPEGFAVDWHLVDDLIFNYCFKLELVQNGRNRPADRPHFDAHLSCGRELENVCLPLSVPNDSDLEQQLERMNLAESTTLLKGERKLAVASTSRRFRSKLPRRSESFTPSATPTRKRRRGEETESATKRSKSLLLVPSTSGSSASPYFPSTGSLEYVCEEMDTFKISWNGDDEEM